MLKTRETLFHARTSFEHATLSILNEGKQMEWDAAYGLKVFGRIRVPECPPLVEDVSRGTQRKRPTLRYARGLALRDSG